mmetsp:Transcript_1327/g.5394  ORF Transcript_1327/g.5394 Transcript_1327/m.5394 type:complete len:399 (+) Transcript_1327:761-1957(+)
MPRRSCPANRSTRHNELIQGHDDDIAPHLLVDERRGSSEWLAFHEMRGRGLGGQREGAHGVHDHVHPEEGNCGERKLGDSRSSRDEVETHRHHIHDQLELEELANGLEHVAPPQHSLGHRLDVIVEDDNVASLLGNFGAGDAERKAHVGILERGRVVGAVARDGNNLTERLLQVAQHELIGRGGAREYPDLDRDGFFLALAHLAEHRALKDEAVVAVLENSSLPRDGLSGELVITGDHAHDHSRLAQEPDSLRRLRADRVLDAGDAEEREVSLRGLVAQTARRRVEVDVRDAERAKTRGRHRGDGFLRGGEILRGEVPHRAVRLHHLGAELHDNLRRSLDVKSDAAVHRHGCAHALSRGREVIPLRHVVLLAPRHVREVAGLGKITLPRGPQILDELK